jgi:hypothetical protein
MTRIEQLTALRDAVRDGRESDAYDICMFLTIPGLDLVLAGFHKDMNAALSLFAALLPGWGWSAGSYSVSDDAMVFPDFNCPIHGKRLRAELPILVNGQEWPEATDIDLRPPGDPARALTLATLEALIAKSQSDGLAMPKEEG